MSRGAAAAALALAVLVGACGGDEDDDGREGATPTTAATTTTAAPAAESGPTQAAPATTAPSSPATTKTGGKAAAGSAAAPPTSSRPAGAAASGFAAPGVYRYATTGRFSSTAGGEQPRDGETLLTVDPPAGGDQRSVRQGPGRTTEQLLRVQAGSAFLVSLRQTEQGITKEVRPSPPALAFPGDAAPGRTWSWRAVSTDGQTTVDAAFRVVRIEEQTVGADRVAAVVVEAVVSTSGDVVSTSRQTLWVSPAHRLVVRLDETTDGRLGALTFRSTSSDRLASLRPS